MDEWKYKNKDQRKNKFWNNIGNGRLESDFILLEKLITELKDLIFSTKTLHYENLAKKLNNSLLQTKTNWSILKTFYNNKKIPQIPPLLEDDKFLTDMKTKADIFSKFFAEQCTSLKNDSKRPLNQIYLT